MNLKKISYTFVLVVLNSINLFSAKDNPLSEELMKGAGGFEGGDGNQVGAPIDQGIYFLVLAAILYGAYIFYKKSLKAKKLN